MIDSYQSPLVLLNYSKNPCLMNFYNNYSELIIMPKKVSKAQKAFLAAKKDFFRLAEKTEEAITRERDVLRDQLQQANAHLVKARAKLAKAEKKFEKTSTAAAKKKVKKMSKLLERANSETVELRETLRSVRERLQTSKEYATAARFFQRGIDKLDKEWDKIIQNKATKKKTVNKKKVTKKKVTKKKVTKKAVRKTAVTTKQPE
ncbi:MAG: hypothetical protein OEQ39_12400 [Gammaproteobacteria bacterium]|nr:hypothetical protein [Gammaproteobacteria bacterium]